MSGWKDDPQRDAGDSDWNEQQVSEEERQMSELGTVKKSLHKIELQMSV